MIHRRTSPANSPRGFTLVEVLLALALTAIVAGAIYIAFNMYQRLTTAGRDQVERSQVARAIHRKMAVDIRSVVYKPPEQQQNEEGGEELSEEEMLLQEEMIQIEVTDPTQSIATTAKGIIGGPDALVLHISRPPRGLAYTPADQPMTVNSRRSDLISVTYLLASENSTGLQGSVAVRTQSGGLARLVGDRLVMDTLDNQGAVDELASTATILAKEVTSLQFRYFDGLQWYESWNSEQTGTLPRSIEVTLGIVNTAEKNAAAEPVPVIYRFVISVPISDPKPPEEELGF